MALFHKLGSGLKWKNFFNFSRDAAEKYFDFWWRKYTKGPYLNDVYTIFRILDPSPLASGQIHSTEIMQPPLLCLHLGNLLLFSVWTSFKYDP